jgi:Carboxypeptidase regulatory-like domain
VAESPVPALSQNGTGSITGTVTDSTGGMVAGASVTVTHIQTNISRHVATNESGSYTIPQLPVGIYEVAAERNGFKIATQTGIKLNIADVLRVDLTLAVGATTENVTVGASTLQLNTENAEVATTISDKFVSDLPLNGRNFQQLQLLDGSAYETQGGAIGEFRPTQTLADGGAVGIGGSRQTSSGFLIDGVNNRDIGYGSAILVPSLDALQEFKMQTKTYSAEFGTSANQIQLHFKSGTNSLHGTAYEYLRNNDFDARGFLEPSVPALNQNQFGYSLGGPVVIPKLYDGRNKSFFFANYEGLRIKQGTAPIYQVVPTAAQWAGQISVPIVDPLTGVPFPNNQVPASRISQFAKAFQKFVYAPNTNSPLGNWVGSVSEPDVANQQNYRFDQNIGPNNSFFFRYSISTNDDTTGGPNGTGIYNQTIAATANHAYQISYTRVFSPNIVNQATYGYVHAGFNTVAPTINSSDLAAFGVQGGFAEQSSEIPLVVWSGSSGGLSEFGTNYNLPTIDTTNYWNGSDTLNVNLRNHSLDIGFSLLSWNHNYGKGATLGGWTFDGVYSGDPFTDFLLGNPQQISIDVPSPLAPTAASAVFNFPQYTWSTFVQDRWKVSPRLTLDLGLRYEFYLPAREADNRYMWFNPNFPGGGECTANKMAAAEVGQNGLLQYCGSQSSPSPKLSFAPRIGVAFLPTKNEKTVIRAGYGLFYDASDEGDTVNAADNYPYLGSEAYNGTPVTNILSTSMPIAPITSLRPVQGSDLGFVFLATNKKLNPYVQDWSLSVENSPLKDTTVELGYQGSEGTHYPTRYSLNQPFQYNPANPLPISARRPYPNFGEIYPQIFALSSNYNAATVKVRHESHSLVLLAAYTFSKSMDVRSGTYGAGDNDIGGYAGPMNSANFQEDYGPSSFNIKQRAIFSFVHNIPVGRGERFLTNLNKPADLLIGGWQLDGIVAFQTGQPFSIEAADINGLIDTNGQRANLVGNPFPSGFQKNAAHWFNTAAFAQPAQGFFGDSGRNSLTSPGYEDWDLSLIKNFNVSERLRFQFRAESFNTFNHTNYGFPDFGIIDPGFGALNSAAPARILQLGAKAIF